MDESIDLRQKLADIEVEHILRALKCSTGVIPAAKKLKMNRTTLIEKLKKYGINPYDHTRCTCNCHKRSKQFKEAPFVPNQNIE